MLVPLLLGATAQTATRPRTAAPITGHSDRAALLYAEAAAAVRRDDCAGAARTLAPLTSAKGPETAFAKLLQGFHAHACGQPAVAEERLFAAQGADRSLEDWRLYVLSDASRANGHLLLARASLAKLLGDYPESPLRAKAFVEAARLAWDAREAERALELVRQARREEVGGDEGAGLEALAWQIGKSLNDLDIQREAGRRLLSEWPAKAGEMQVAEIFRSGGSGSDSLAWSEILNASQLQKRARALLDLKLDSSAQAALSAVPSRDRDTEWALLQAEVYTRGDRGDAALQLLASQSAAGAADQLARLEWARAEAALDMATAARGRANLPAADRQRMRQVAHQHLRRVAQAGGDPKLSAKALRALYSDLAEDERFEDSIAVLRQLREIDPRDKTGSSHLWERGWREYGRRNYSGAVGYWTELFSLYPDDSNGRRGRYWTARAFEALGETERAQQIYREVGSSDTTDFYRKNALARLRKQPVRVADEREAEPWPVDAALIRARLLTDLGLDDLAATELALVRGDAQERSVKALEAVLLSRTGNLRKSMLTIREAFPALGGPHQATLPDEARRLYYPVNHQDTIRTWAQKNGLPVHVVYGIIRQESGFDTQAQSWAGARGLMQLMPATARELSAKAGLTYSHEKLSDPAYNVRLGTTYFSQVLNMFDHNLELALAGYNGGPYRIKRLWREAGSGELDRFLEGLNIEESKTYVKRILVLSDSYRQLYPTSG